jgi:hypothetical protein
MGRRVSSSEGEKRAGEKCRRQHGLAYLARPLKYHRSFDVYFGRRKPMLL